MIPQALNIAPHAVTYRQLYFWHKALVIGAVAKASVVMLPGIQAARATEVPTLNVSIMLKKKTSILDKVLLQGKCFIPIIVSCLRLHTCQILRHTI